MKNPYRRGVLLITLAALLWRAWAVSRWNWQDDDWVYLGHSATMPLGDYLFQMYNGHLMPGEFFVMWAITEIAPLNFAIPIALTALGSALVVVLWSRAFAALAGERTWTLLPLALLALTPLLIRPTMWWASSLQVLPMQACLAWGVLVAARMAERARTRDIVHLAAAFVIALTFWEKSIVSAIPLTLTLLSAHGGRPLARARTHWRSIAVLGAVALGYAAIYLTIGRLSDDQREKGINFSSPPTPSEAVEFFWSGLGNLLGPGLLGGPWGSLPTSGDFYSTASIWVAVTCTLILSFCILVSLRMRRGAGFVIMVAAGYTGLAWALVLFSSRFVNLGMIAINDERYTVDCFAVWILSAVLVWSGPRARGTAARMPRSATVAICVSLMASLAAGNIWAVQRIGPSPASSWLSTMKADLSTASSDRSDGAPLVLVDRFAPDSVMAWAFWADRSRLSFMLAPLEPDVVFNQAGDQLWAVSDDGTLEEVEIDASVGARPGPIQDCGYVVEPGSRVEIPLSGGLFYWDWGVQISTFSSEPASLTIVVDEAQIPVSLPSGPHIRKAQYEGEVPETIVVSSSPDSGTVCVTDLVVGPIGPAASAG